MTKTATYLKQFVFTGILMAISASGYSQCSPARHEGQTGGTGFTKSISPTCSWQYTSNANGVGGGSRRQYTGITADKWYNFQRNNNGANVSCGSIRFRNSNATTVSPYYNLTGSTLTVQAPAGTDRVEFRTTGSWTSGTSALLRYREATPSNITANSDRTALCAGGSFDLSSSGGTITGYEKGETSITTNSTQGITYTWTGGYNPPNVYNPGNHTGSTTGQSGTYTVVADNAGCTKTDGIAISVVADPSVTTQPSGATICAGGTYAPDIASTGGTPSRTYQWQYSSNNSTWNNTVNGTPAGATYSNATNQTSFSVSGITATGNHYYRCRVFASGSGCGTANSNSATLVVQSSVVASPGTVSGNTTVCPGANYTISNASVATAGSPQSTIYYRFYRRKTDEPNLTGWVDISGQTTNTSFTSAIPDAPGTYQFRRNAYSGCNSTESSSNVLTVTVYNNFASGTIQEDQDVCSVDGPATLSNINSAVGGNGSYTYQWQSSTNNSTWSNIGGATSTTYTPQNTVSTRYYRRRVSETSGCFTSPIYTGQPQDIAWTSVHADATVDGNSIARTSGASSWNCGGSSLQRISKGGYIQFRGAQTNRAIMMGLDVGDPNDNWNSIDYCFYLKSNGTYDLREDGATRTVTGNGYTTSTVFRIEWNAATNNIEYYAGGVLKYTSTIVPSAPLYADFSMAHQGGFTNVVMQGDDNAEVIINQTPDPPSTSGDVDACGQVTVLTSIGANGTTNYFYSDAGLSTQVGSGTSYTTNVSDTYYVTSVNTTTGCESTAESVVVTSTPSFALALDTSAYGDYAVACYNGSNGTITPSTTGGTAPFTYLWSTGSTASSLTGLTAGTYSVSVEDDGNCTEVASVTINEPAEITFNAPTLSDYNGYNVSCNSGSGSSDGTITVNPTGGMPPYDTYVWNGGGSTQTVTGRPAGTNSVTLMDANNCPAGDSYTLTAPPALNISLADGYICNSFGNYIGSEVTVSASGGVSPYGYSEDNSTFFPPTTVAHPVANLFGSYADGLSPTFWVEDDNGCKVSDQILIDYPDPTAPSGVCDFIYVAEGGAGTLGTKECPTSLTVAINTIYANNTNRDRILMKAGNYSFSSTIDIPSGLSIEGGYQEVGGEWIKNTSLTTRLLINPPEDAPSNDVRHRIGITADGKTGFALKDLTIEAYNRVSVGGSALNMSGTTTNGYGKSIYGVHVSGCNNYTIARVKVITGDASAGAAGANGGTAGAPGGNGAGGGGNGSNGPYCQWLLFGCVGGSSSGGSGGAGYGNGGNGGGGGTGRCCSGPGSGGNGSNGAAGAVGSAGSNGGAPSGSGLVGGGAGSGGAGGTVHTNRGNGNSGYYEFAGGGCDNPGSAPSGTIGNNGSNGGNGGNGSNGSFSANSNKFFYPGSQGGRGGRGGQGAGGGGGGGGGGQSVDFSSDMQGGGGGGGGGRGGYGGYGGYGGKGGGSAIGIYINNSATGQTLSETQISQGAAGAGGAAGSGLGGGAGGNGGSRGSGNCEGYNGGLGGKGGTGGSGGNGGVGQPGYSYAIRNNGSVQNSVTLPSRTVTVSQYQGCTNSVIDLTTSSGNWGMVGSSNPKFVNDYTSASNGHGYANNVSDIKVSYDTPGTYDLVVGGDTYKDMIVIVAGRSLPVISSFPAQLCDGNDLTLNTSTTGVAYEWTIQKKTVTNFTTPAPVHTSTSQNPTFNFPAGTATGDYQIKLSVKDDCCGWSVPVYADLEIITVPDDPGLITGDINPCENEEGVPFSITTVPGATNYTWTVPSNASITGGGGVTDIEVDFGLTNGNITVTPGNVCGDSDNPGVLAIVLDAPPVANINGFNPLNLALPCSGSELLTANGSGGDGNGSFTYSWSAPSVVSGQTVTANTANTYTVNILDAGSGCTGTANAFVTLATSINAGFLTWTGAVDDQWKIPGNWDCLTVPTLTDDVIIPAGPLPNEPVIHGDPTPSNATQGNCYTIEVQGATILEIESDDNAKLNVAQP